MLQLKQIHETLTKAAGDKMAEVLAALGLKQPKSFYQILSGERQCSPAEQQAIADIYGLPVAEIFAEVPKKGKAAQKHVVKIVTDL
ncbi:MAG: hypothetical protein EOO16_13230 [Chitinophagaceae bacterium]|nr:MAG: hypothetical protein EOO16_13230 [Chitinophagaceae bacterium]